MFFNEDQAGNLCKGKSFYCKVSAAACGHPDLQRHHVEFTLFSESACAHVGARACRKPLAMNISFSEQLEAGLPIL